MTDAYDHGHEEKNNDIFLSLYPQGEMDHGLFYDCWCEPTIKTHQCMNCGTIHRIYLHRSHINLEKMPNVV